MNKFFDALREKLFISPQFFWVIAIVGLINKKLKYIERSRSRPDGRIKKFVVLNEEIKFNGREILLDGKIYLSLKSAASLTGYHSDYLGRLARHEKIKSKRVGKQWFIEKDSVLALPRAISSGDFLNVPSGAIILDSENAFVAPKIIETSFPANIIPSEIEQFIAERSSDELRSSKVEETTPYNVRSFSLKQWVPTVAIMILILLLTSNYQYLLEAAITFRGAFWEEKKIATIPPPPPPEIPALPPPVVPENLLAEYGTLADELARLKAEVESLKNSRGVVRIEGEHTIERTIEKIVSGFSEADVDKKISDLDQALQVKISGLNRSVSIVQRIDNLGSITLGSITSSNSIDTSNLTVGNLIITGACTGCPGGGSSAGGWTDDGTVVRLTDSGNFVGIGTTSPGQKLSVAGDILGNNIIGSYFTGTSTATSTLLGGLSAVGLSSTNGLSISGGSLLNTSTATSSFSNGISLSAGCFQLPSGTCLTSSGGDATTLDTIDSTQFLRSDTSDSFTSGTLTFNSGTTLQLSNISPSTLLATDNSGNVIASTTPYALSFHATGTAATSTFAGGLSAASSLYVLQNGNVGIGTTSPGAKLEIGGDLAMANTGRLRWRTSSGSLSTVLSWSGDTLFLANNSANPIDINAQQLIFNTNSSERMRINSTGLVGIGTTTPGSILSVQGVGNFQSGTSTIYTGLTAPGFLATSSGVTITGGSLLNTSTATSSFANGIALSGGCFAMPNGTCLSNSGGDATTLDTLDSTQFLRSDTSDSFTSGTLTFNSGTTIALPNIGNNIILSTNSSGNLVGTTTPSFAAIFATSTTATSTFALGGISIGTSTPFGNGLFTVGTSTANFYIDRVSGKVGIGTTTPVSKFEIIGASLTGSDGFDTRAGGLTVQYGKDAGTATAGFQDYTLDKPILTLKTPNGVLSPNSGVNTALLIQGQPWAVGQNTGLAIEMGTPTESSRIVHFGSNATAVISRLQLQTHSATAGLWNPGIKIYGDGTVTVGNPNDPASTPSSALFSLWATTTTPTIDSILSLVAADNATSILRVDNAGNFGIFDSTPDAVLDIASSTAATLFRVDDSGDGDTSPFIIDGSGLVGIGTTTPYTKLSVVGETVAANFTATTTSNNTFPNLISTNSTTTNATTTSLFSTTASSTNLFSSLLTVGGNGLVVDSSRNVGIGTASPTNLLHIARPGSSQNSAVLIQQLDTSGTAGIQFGGVGSNNWIIGQDLSDGQNFKIGFGTTFSTTRLVIDTAGLVGIGTTSPGSILSVQGVGNFVAGATSTIYNGLQTAGLNATSSGITITGGNILLSSGATSTFNNGLALSAGCFLMPNGTCLSNSGGDAATLDTLDSTQFLRSDTSDSFTSGTLTFGSGTTLQLSNISPSTILAVNNSGNVVSSTTPYVASINATSTATSTFVGGISSGGLASSNGLTISGGNISFGGTSLNALDGGGLTTTSGALAVGAGTCITVNANDVAVTANCTDATTLDSIDSGSFLRSDASDSFTSGTLTFNSGTTLNLSNVSPNTILSVNGLGNVVSSTTPYALSFHATGTAATSTFAGGLTVDGTSLVVDYSSGNVGIGTAAPTGLLHIARPGTSEIPAVLIQQLDTAGTAGIRFSGVGSNTWIIGQDLNDGQNFKIGYGATFSTTRLTIDGSGNVGIGTTSPWGLLSVNPNGIAGPAFVVGSSTATNFIVTNGGNVGIGTTSPGQKLSVAGDILGNNIIGSYFTGTSTATSTLLGGISSAGLASSNGLTITGGSLLNTSTATSSFSNGISLSAGCFQLPSGTCLTSSGGDATTLDTLDSTQFLRSDTSDSFTSGTLTFDSGTTLKLSNLSPSTLLALDNSGNVIASTTPYALSFHATGTAATSTFAGGFAIETSGLVYDFSTNNVGIGTAAPGSKFVVANGEAGLSVTTAGITTITQSSGRGVSITPGTAGVTFQKIGASGGGAEFVFIGGNTAQPSFAIRALGNQTGDLQQWQDSNSNVLNVVSAAGNVGIGTTSPGQKLSVAGDILGNNIIGSYFTGTSTATSTLIGGISTAGLSTSNGLTISGGSLLQTNNATNTLGGGLVVSTGNIRISTLTGCNTTSVLETDASGNIQCGSDAGASGVVTSVSNTDSTLTISPTTGDVVASLNRANPNIWTGLQQFSNASTTLLTVGTITATSTATSTFTGGISTGGLASSNGLTISGGSILQTNEATSTLRGLNVITGGLRISTIQTCNSTNALMIAASSGNVFCGTITQNLSGWTDDGTTVRLTTITDNVGIGTTSPGQKLSVAGDILGNNIIGSYFTATSTATSTFTGGISSGGLASSNGLTITGGSLLNTSTATSTFSNGINVTAGCLASNGICLTNLGQTIDLGSAEVSGTLTVGNGGTGNTAFTAGSIIFSNGTILTQDNANLFFDDANNRFGIGTTTPGVTLSVYGSTTIQTAINSANAFRVLNAASSSVFTVDTVNGSSTIAGVINVGSGTSTFNGGVGTGGLSSTNGVTLTGGALLATSIPSFMGSSTISNLSILNTSTSTLLGGLAAQVGGLSSTAGLTITGGSILNTSTATSTFTGGISTGGLASSNGLTITGGNILLSSGATSTFTNGIKLSGGCFQMPSGTCLSSSGGDATTLDTLDSTQFLRSDTSDSFTSGTLTFDSGTTLKLSNLSPSTLLALDNSGNVIASTTPYALSFHATGTAATSTFAGGFAIETSGLVYDFSTNNVGIGTASPGRILHVYGSGTVNPKIETTGAGGNSALIEFVGGAVNADWIVGTNRGDIAGADENLFLFSNLNSGIVIQRAGNVGIGEVAPGSKLSVSGSGSFGAGYDTTAAPTNGLLVEGLVGIGTTSPWAKLSVNNYSSGASSVPLFTVASSTGTGATSTAFIIDSIGNVGIGTSSPGSILSVQSVANFQAPTSTIYTGLVSPGFLATSSGVTITGGAFRLNSESFSDLTGTGLDNTNGVLTPNCVAITGSADLCDGNDATGGSSIKEAFTFTSNGGVIHGATTTPIVFQSGLIGFGSSTFAGLLNVGSFVSTSTLGVGTTSPWGQLSVEALQGTVGANTPIFVVSDQGTSTPFLYVSGNNGNVGIGTAAPAGKLTLGSGQLLVPSGTAAAPSISFSSNADTGFINPGTNHIGFAAAGVSRMLLQGGDQFELANGLLLGFNSAGNGAGIDAGIVREGIGILGQRGGSAGQAEALLAQSYRLYNTFTSATNFERAELSWGANSNVFTLQTTAGSGGGTVRNIALMGGNVGIGTTSPLARLSISATSTATTLPLFSIESPTPNALATSSLILVDAYGRLGLGTSTPSYTLSVNGSTLLGGSATSTGFIYSQGLVGTSTFLGGFQASALNISTTTATSTFASGIKLNGLTFTNLGGSGCSGLANGGKLTTDANGGVICSADVSGSGSSYPFTPTSIGGTIHQATSSPMYFSSGLLAASSTLGYLNLGTFDATNTSATSTIAGGLKVDGTSLVVDYSSGNVGIGTGVSSYALTIKDADNTAGNIDFLTRWEVVGDTGGHTLDLTYEPTPNAFIFSSFNNNRHVAFNTGGNVGIGTTSPGSILSVQGVGNFQSGTSTIYTGLTAPGFLATSSGLTISGGNLLITSGATSTSNNGFNITAGCFAISGTCVGGGSGSAAGTDGQIQYNNGGSAFGGASGFIWDDTNLRLGVGTTSPISTLSVSGSTWLDSNTINFASTSAPFLTLAFNKAATSTIPNNQFYAWTIGTTTTNTPIFRINTALNNSNATIATTSIIGGFSLDNGAFNYDSFSGVASVDSLSTGPMAFDNDAGILSWMDMPSSTTTAGIYNSYSAQIDSASILTIFATTTTSGNITKGNVGIGTTTPPWTLTVVGGICISTGSTCPAAEVNGGLRVDTAGTVASDNPGDVFDIAERYPASEPVGAGEIVALDNATTSRAMVKKAVFGDVAIGVVSTRPALAINGSEVILGAQSEGTSTRPLVALTGRVPVRVNLEGGEIKKGDRIALSSVPGVGAKATSSGMTIGIALDSFAPVSGLTFDAGGEIWQVMSPQTEGEVLVFVNLGWSQIEPAMFTFLPTGQAGASTTPLLEMGSGKIKANYVLDMDDKDIVNVRSILSSGGAWSIDENGKLTIDEVHAKKLCLDDVCVTKEELKALLENNRIPSNNNQISTLAPEETPGVSGSPTPGVGEAPSAENASSTPNPTPGVENAQTPGVSDPPTEPTLQPTPAASADTATPEPPVVSEAEPPVDAPPSDDTSNAPAP